jgi:hypothetical protein
LLPSAFRCLRSPMHYAHRATEYSSNVTRIRGDSQVVGMADDNILVWWE